MIEIFRTDIRLKTAGKQVVTAIKEQFPGVVATVDLDDHEKILRVVGAWAPVPVEQIVELVQKQGYACEWIND